MSRLLPIQRTKKSLAGKVTLLDALTLSLHLIGIILMAGTTITDYLTFRTFWELADQNDASSITLILLMSRYGAIIRMGGILVIVSGIGLMIFKKATCLKSLRFRLKMILFLLILFHGRFAGKMQAQRIRGIVIAHPTDFVRHTVHLRKKLNQFYPVQISLYLLIIIISAKGTFSWRPRTLPGLQLDKKPE